VPVWIYAHKYRELGRPFDETDLVYLLEEVLAPKGVEVKELLSGDLHHYRRHEEVGAAHGATPVQKITAGGGGAFLHATHDADVSMILEEGMYPGAPARTFELKASYPDERRSWRLSFGNLLFALKNPNFGIVPAVLYQITAWIIAATIGFQEPRGTLDALRLTGLAMIVQPGAALWLLGVAALFVVFTDTHSKTYRVAGGLAHAVTHWNCIFLPRLERDDPLGMDPARLDLRTLPREQRLRLRRRLDHRVIRDGTLSADLLECLRPPW
jgi:hypothetical protein